MWLLYQIALGFVLVLLGPYFVWSRGGRYRASLPARLGRRDAGAERQPSPGALWLHAVSVGEVGVAATLARALPAELPLLVTTVTPTGQQRARALLGARAAVDFLPFDLGFAVRRFFERHAPRGLVLIEGDLWPLVLREARRRGLPVVVVNGRISDRNLARQLRLRRLLARPLDWLHAAVQAFGVQSALDRERYLRLGVEPERLQVTGNLKYESPAPRREPELEERLRALAGGRPILVAGSTMAGEEEAVLEAFSALGGGARALLLLAPRHPERWEEVADRVRSRGFALARRAALPAADGVAVVLLDSLGELAGLYALGAAAFVGGTLAATGGHNPLEPARWGVPIAVGPSMENFREIAEQFDRAGAWRRVADAAQLAAVWREWLDDPAAARAVADRASRLLEVNRGALDRTLLLLEPLLRSPGREA
jgi:3-deoxy-D-manno-octulosonic-acid transferase